MTRPQALDPTFWTEPRLSIIGVPEFRPPAHLPVNWIGEATDGERLAEFSGRLCYMSQANPANKTNADYLSNILEQRHGSVFEHANYSVLFEGVSRTFTHELVRHRAGFAYSQLSQRYVDESDTSFVIPPAMMDVAETHELAGWKDVMLTSRSQYKELADYLFVRYAHIQDKVHRRKTAREAARSVLPNATETKIVATANARAWRTMLELRTNPGAEREMRRGAVACLRLLKAEAPHFFPDFAIYRHKDGEEAALVDYHKV